jgi:hypothetical protein
LKHWYWQFGMHAPACVVVVVQGLPVVVVVVVCPHDGWLLGIVFEHSVELTSPLFVPQNAGQMQVQLVPVQPFVVTVQTLSEAFQV